jgi:hypothetical protein
MSPPHKDLPVHSLVAASFAESLASAYVNQGGNLSAIFTAFVGLVSARDDVLCAECLEALEQVIFSSSASAENGAPRS